MSPTHCPFCNIELIKNYSIENLYLMHDSCPYKYHFDYVGHKFTFNQNTYFLSESKNYICFWKNNCYELLLEADLSNFFNDFPNTLLNILAFL